MVDEKIDYVTYDSIFDREYLNGLLEEMKWLEKHYEKEFIDSLLKRNRGPEVKDGDYENYHRVSKVFWLTFIK